MSNIWFTADHHFGHTNIIEYANRAFNSVDEMNEVMIERWNERVGVDDVVYYLGDIGLCSPKQLMKILDRLNGRICLIKGNHDKSALACYERFHWIKDYYELEIEDVEFSEKHQLIVLFHYIMRVWNKSHWGTFHLFGHSHGSLLDDPNSRSFDIGVDCHNYYPINYDSVKEIMKQKKWKPPFEIDRRNIFYF